VPGAAENEEEAKDEEEKNAEIDEDDGADEEEEEVREPVESEDAEPQTSPGVVTTDENGRLLPRYSQLVAHPHPHPHARTLYNLDLYYTPQGLTPVPTLTILTHQP
jgi:hypothetical protein